MTLTLPPLPEWFSRAACAEVGGDIWYPEKGESVEPAKTICAGCEVQAECLQYAMDNHERYGVWGGVSERGRRPKNGRTSTLRYDEIVQLHTDGVPEHDIVDQLDVTARTVQHVISNHRKRTEAAA